jgi:hypothetical protein
MTKRIRLRPQAREPVTPRPTETPKDAINRIITAIQARAQQPQTWWDRLTPRQREQLIRAGRRAWQRIKPHRSPDKP